MEVFLVKPLFKHWFYPQDKFSSKYYFFYVFESRITKH